ncbi:hypothetical protein Tco_1008174 [Tanacetum coccineum]
MANFPRLDELAIAANTRGLFDGTLVYRDRENAKDLEFANGLHNLWAEFLERTNEKATVWISQKSQENSKKRARESEEYNAGARKVKPAAKYHGQTKVKQVPNIFNLCTLKVSESFTKSKNSPSPLNGPHPDP